MFIYQSSGLSIHSYIYLFSILNPGTHGPAILSMSTFGKDGREINLDMVDSNRNRSVNPTGIYLYKYLSIYSIISNYLTFYLSTNQE